MLIYLSLNVQTEIAFILKTFVFNRNISLSSSIPYHQERNWYKDSKEIGKNYAQQQISIICDI
jgi:hypothetical protein